MSAAKHSDAQPSGGQVKHTPGPWTAPSTGIYDAAGCMVATLSRSSRPISEVVANARLIAAAPEMLAALEEMFEHCAMIHNNWGEDCNRKQANAAIDAGRAAIAKATGISDATSITLPAVPAIERTHRLAEGGA